MVHGISDFHRGHGGDESLQERVVDLVVNNESLRGNARLAVVDHARGNGRRDSGVHVGARHDDERIAAAELHDGFLEVLASGARDRAPCTFAASERDRNYTIVSNDRLDHV